MGVSFRGADGRERQVRLPMHLVARMMLSGESDERDETMAAVQAMLEQMEGDDDDDDDDDDEDEDDDA